MSYCKFRISARIFGLLAFVSLISITAYGQGGSGDLSLYPNVGNGNYRASTDELVTVGVPFAACVMGGAGDGGRFRLLDEKGGEVAVFVKETLRWPVQAPCNTGSVRAIKVQFLFDATQGEKVYKWDLAGRNTGRDRSESPIVEITSANPLKGGLAEPRVFAVHTPDYLVSAMLVPPTSVAGSNSYDTGYFPATWKLKAQGLDYTTSEAANWLFDRVSTGYRQAMRRGEVEHYREAYLSHEFYVARIDDGTVPDYKGVPQSSGSKCVGGFAMEGKALACDPKYVYSEPVKLHLALTGDDSWQPDPNAYANTREQMWKQMADILVRGDRRSVSGGAITAQGFMEPYTSIDNPPFYTERNAGIGLTTVLNSCQLTLDGEVCAWADRIIDNIYLHKTNNPDGLGDWGYLGHSWRRHENYAMGWAGYLSVKDGTVIEVEQALGKATALQAGSKIVIGNQWVDKSYELKTGATDLGGGRWRLETTEEVSGDVGGKVWTNQWDVEGDRAFSVWMSAQVADAVWQYYHWTTDSQRRAKAAEILLGLGEAVTKYGMWGGRINPPTASLIEGAFSSPAERIKFDTSPGYTIWGTNCMTVAPFPLYASNHLVNVEGPKIANYMREYLNLNSDFSDHHIPDVMFIITTGIHFQQDPAKSAAMKALAKDMLDWFDRHECTYRLGPPRAYAWQGKPDPFGSYQWVMKRPSVMTQHFLHRSGR